MPFTEIWADELYERMRNGEEIYLLDVRELVEWLAEHIPGAIHIPLGEIPRRYVELDKEKEIYIICRSGNRSAMAARYLSQLGFKTVNVAGGMLNWPGEIEVGA
ncbi:rhodanese-like domain-containing protein [Thermicanus aegyptius]|uniref:rhodanese-like domain-containing protein n=1 Tax=Thermicanus aegyptius TaxID=94009 RepID=UPI0004108188|nr:rhodanese-like domain-containing protein [Thermicanus aegyptius]